MKKFDLGLMGYRKRFFFNFCFFHFSKFQMTIVKNLMEKPSFFKWVSRVLIKLHYVTNIFDLHTFDN